MLGIFLRAIFSLWLLLLSSLIDASIPLNFDPDHNARLDEVWNYYPNQLISESENQDVFYPQLVKPFNYPHHLSVFQGIKMA